MALTGIEIFKRLPKTNCGECGVPTCLAFAMRIATAQAEITSCPHASEEVRAELEESAAPPIRVVTIGKGEGAIKIGGDTVLFRHEKRFENPCGIGLLISDTMEESDRKARVEALRTLKYLRVGLTLKADFVAIKEESKDPQRFIKAIEAARDGGWSLILMSKDPLILREASQAFAKDRPLIYAADRDNWAAVGAIAKDFSLPIAVLGNDLEDLVNTSQNIMNMGIKEIVLDSGARSFKKALEDQIMIRRYAILKKMRPFGFPTITFPCEMADANLLKESLIASAFIAKYASLVTLSELRGESLFPLLLERMNIYTDPQRSMAVDEGIYEIGNPDANSPVIVSSNFSLTYFIVSGEVENSRVPCWLLVKDTEGLSVLTAWAAGKFVADTIAPFVKKSGIEGKITHRKLVIPGLASSISGELEAELPDWEIIIGPREAAHLPSYLKMWKS